MQAILSKQTAQSKTTASHKRLVGDSWSFMNTTWQVVDSNIYTYSNARGSQFNFTYMFFGNYGDIKGLLYDSTANYSDDGSGNLDLNNATTALYDGSNRKISDISLTSNPPGTPLKNNIQNVYVYDGAGNITMQYAFKWNTATKKWDSSGKTENAFNTANKLLTSVDYKRAGTNWVQNNRTTNTYDGSGNLTQSVYAMWIASTWIDQSRETFTYYTNNKMQTRLSEDYQGSAWVNNTRDSFGYSGTDFYTYNESRNWNTDSSRWDNAYKEVKHLNSVNLPDTIVNYNVDTTTGNYEPGFTNVWSYDSDNNPVEAQGIFYYMGTPIPVTANKFYYQYYWDLGVSGVVNKNTFSVYPNPAKDVLNITTDKAVKGNVTAVIINTAGQLVVKSNFAGSSATSLSLSALQPGTYAFVLTDEQGNKLYSQAIVKQ